jgi:hypothetical protein
MNAEQIVHAAIDAAGAAGGVDEVAAIAAKGVGAMTFTDADMVTLLAEYGTPGDALYAIQLEAQRRISSDASDNSEANKQIP